MPTRKRKNKRRVSKNSNDSTGYQALEPRQLLAVTASLTGPALTVEGDNSSNQVVFRVNSGDLEISDDGGATFTNDLDGGTGIQTHTMNPANPLELIVSLRGGKDNLVFDLQGTTGLGKVTVNDGAGTDTISVSSDLDLESRGPLKLEADILNIDDMVRVVASEGIEFIGGDEGLVTIGQSATLSSREIQSGGDHESDPSIEDSGNISIKGETIQIGDGAKLLAFADGIHTPGNINIAAESKLSLINLTNLDLSDPQVREELIHQQAHALVDIGSAILKGNDVSITAKSIADKQIPTFGEIYEDLDTRNIPASLEKLILIGADELDKYIDKSLPIPAHVAMETTSAIINLGSNATIESTRNISLSAEAKSSENSLVASKHFGMAAVILDSESHINIESGSVLEAEGRVDIETSTTVKGNAKATNSKNLAKDDSGRKLGLAIAYADSTVKSLIDVNPDTTIHAGTDININAKGENKLKSDANAGVFEDGGVGLVLAYTSPKSEVRARVDGTLDARATNPAATFSGVRIRADLITSEESLAYSGLGGEIPDKVPEVSPSKVLQNLADKWLKPMFKKLGAKSGNTSNNFTFDFSGALAVNSSDHDVEAIVGTLAKIKSDGNVIVTSNWNNREGDDLKKLGSRTFAESVIKNAVETEKGLRASPAAVLGFYDSANHAFLEPGATVDSKGTIAINATTKYPQKPVKVVRKPDRDLKIKGNSWARSHSEEGKSEFAGSLNFQEHTTSTQAYISDNALINQDPAYADIDQKLEVIANSDIVLMDISGVLELELASPNISASQVWDKLKNLQFGKLFNYVVDELKVSKDKSDIDFGTGSENTAMGGAFLWVDLEETTTAKIGDNVQINTGSDGGVQVQANGKQKHMMFSMAGLQANKVGVGASISNNLQKIKTTAKIGNGTQISDGAIEVTANHDMEQLNVAGGAIVGSNFGLGVSIATNDIDRDTIASIGDQGTTSINRFSALDASTVNVSAKSDGYALAFGLAGSLPGKKPGDGSNLSPVFYEWVEDSIDSDEFYSEYGILVPVHQTDPASPAKFGLGVSGDVALNDVISKTHAFIQGNADIAARSLNVNANDSTTLGAAGGSAVINSEEKSNGISGSYSQNKMSGSARAWIESASLSVPQGAVTVSAIRDGAIWAGAASAGVVDATGIAGSIALNSVDEWETNAYLRYVTSPGIMSLSLVAQDTSKLYAIAGATGWSDHGGFGASFARNYAKAKTSSTVTNSELRLQEDLSSTALHDATYLAVAGSLGAGSSFSFAGTAAINDLEIAVDSSMQNSHLYQSGNVTFSATDESKVIAISGAASLGKSDTDLIPDSTFQGSGFGGAFAYNSVDQTVENNIRASTIQSDRELNLVASLDGDIKSFAVGVAAQSGAVGLSGSIAINKSTPDLTQEISSSPNIQAEGNIGLTSTMDGTIHSFSGGFAGAKNVAAGVAFSANKITPTNRNIIFDSTIDTQGELDHSFDESMEIKSMAVGGAGAQKFSTGGSIATNNIKSEESLVAHQHSEVTADEGVSLTSISDGTVAALTGGLAGSAGGAIGAAFSYNKIKNHVDVHVLKTKVDSSSGSILVSATNDTSIKSLAVGGSGASNFALGGSVSTNEVDTDLDVHITDSKNVVASGNIDLMAENESDIKALTGGVAGAGSVAVGAAISVNKLNSKLRACIFNSEVTSTVGHVNISSENTSTIDALAIGGAGAGTFAMGGSVAINRMDITMCSCVMDGSTVNAEEGVVISANDTSGIQAIGGGVGFAGTAGIGIAVVDNDITRSVKAAISDSAVDGGIGDVVTDATVNSHQTGIAIGGAIGSSVAASGSIANNQLTQNVEARLAGNRDVVGRHIVVDASANEKLKSHVFSGSGSGSIAVAGATGTNQVDNTTIASIGEQAEVHAKGNVLVSSNDATEVDALAGQAAVGIGIAGLGSSVSTIQVNKDTQAFIDRNASVEADAQHAEAISVFRGEDNASGDFQSESILGVGVQANSSEIINNQSLSGAGGQYAGLAGAVSIESIQPNVEAWIGNGANVKTEGTAGSIGNPETNVNVSAVSNTSVDSQSGAAGIGAAAIAGSFDIGKIQHHVSAHIDAGAIVTALDDIDVQGLSTKDINSDSISAAIGVASGQGSVSVWNIGSQYDTSVTVDGITDSALIGVDRYAHGVSGLSQNLVKQFMGEATDGMDLLDDLRNDDASGVLATVHAGSKLTAGDDIDILAREQIENDATVGGAAVGIVGGGASVSLFNVQSNTNANLGGQATANDRVLVQASLEETSDTNAYAGHGGIAAIGAAVTIVNESSTQSSQISSTGSVTGASDVVVSAVNNQNIEIESGQAAIGIAVAGGSFAKINDTGTTEALIDGADIGLSPIPQHGPDRNHSWATVDSVSVLTDVNKNFDAIAKAIDAGIVTGTGTIAAVSSTPTIQTSVNANSDIMARQKVAVQDASNIFASTDALAITPLAGASLGAAKSQAIIKPDIETTFLNSSVSTDNLTVATNHNSDSIAAGQSMKVSVINADGLTAAAISTPQVDTSVGGQNTDIDIDNDANIQSQVSQTANVDAKGLTVSLVGSGVIRGTADTSGQVSTSLGQDAWIGIGNNLSVLSHVNGESTSNTKAPGYGISNFIGSVSNANASFDATSEISTTSQLTVGGNTNVNSQATRIAESNADASVLAIGHALGSNSSNAIANGTATATVNGDIYGTRSLNVTANESNTTQAIGNSSFGGLISGAGITSKTVANSNVSARIDSVVYSEGDVVVNANNAMTTRAHGQSVNGGAFGFGKTDVSASVSPVVSAVLGDGANVHTPGNGRGNVSLSASQSLVLADPGTEMVSGEAGQKGLVSVHGLSVSADVNPTVETEISPGAQLSANDLSLVSIASNDVSAHDQSVSIGGLISGGKSEASIVNAGSISSRILGNIGSVKDVVVASEATAFADASTIAGGWAGLAGAHGAHASAIVNPTIMSSVGNNLSTSGDLAVTSVSRGDANAESSAKGGSVGFSLGDTEAFAEVSSQVMSMIDPGSNLTVDGDIKLEALHNRLADGTNLGFGAEANAESAKVAVGASAHITDATAASSPSVQTVVGEQSTLFAHEKIELSAVSFSDSNADVGGLAIGALAGTGSVSVNALSHGTTQSKFDRIESAFVGKEGTGTISIVADDWSDANATGLAKSGGILGSGNAASVVADASAFINADLKATAFVSAMEDIEVMARASGDVNAIAIEKSGSLLFNKGNVEATSIWQPTALSLIEANADAGRDIAIKAYVNHLSNGTQDTARTVRADANSNGGALFSGRKAKSTIDSTPTTHAQIGGGTNLIAGNDLLVSARSLNDLGSDADVKLLGLAGTSRADAIVNATVSTRAETLPGAMTNLFSGNDMFFDTSSILTTNADADSKAPTPLALRKAFAEINVDPLHTKTFLTANVNAISNRNVDLFAFKAETSNANASAFMGVAKSTVNNSISTQARNLGATVNARGIFTARAVDPVDANAIAVVDVSPQLMEMDPMDLERLRDAGGISADAAVRTNADIVSGNTPESIVNADGGIRIVSQLEKFNVTAETIVSDQLQAIGVPASESIETNFLIQATQPSHAAIRTEFSGDLGLDFAYISEILDPAHEDIKINVDHIQDAHADHAVHYFDTSDNHETTSNDSQQHDGNHAALVMPTPESFELLASSYFPQPVNSRFVDDSSVREPSHEESLDLDLVDNWFTQLDFEFDTI